MKAIFTTLLFLFLFSTGLVFAEGGNTDLHIPLQVSRIHYGIRPGHVLVQFNITDGTMEGCYSNGYGTGVLLSEEHSQFKEIMATLLLMIAIPKNGQIFWRSNPSFPNSADTDSCTITGLMVQ